MIKELIKTKIQNSKTIYVLKGFNAAMKKFEMPMKHIFDLKIDEDLYNIMKIDNSKIMDDFSKLSSSTESFYCYYEEMYYVEKNNLAGMIKFSEYSIVIIDIGCFYNYYPSFGSEKYDELVKLFDKDTERNNNIQSIYCEFAYKNGYGIVAYNELRNVEDYKLCNLTDAYSINYKKHMIDNKKEYELIDTCSPDIFIEVFNKVMDDEINVINYKKVENRENPEIKKFMYLLNLLGVNINIIDDTAEKIDITKYEYYAEYKKIFNRKFPNFGFRSFPIYENPFKSNKKVRVNQCTIIDTIYTNILAAQEKKSYRDVFVTAPTGAGKSLLFQIPAILAAEKDSLVTIVISPLIGLMNDQVQNIKTMTSCAATINSEYTPIEKDKIKEDIKDGKISIIYVSPETLLSNYDLSSIIGSRKIGLLVVDEAHTVATWGKNFRPDYWYLGEYIDRLRHSSNQSFPIAAFTATATISKIFSGSDMYHDITESLNMTSVTYFGDVRRDEISFDIRVHNKDHAYKEEKNGVVVDRLNEFVKKGEKTLAYFPYVKHIDPFYQEMENKEKVGKYYGNLDKGLKNEALEDLKTGRKTLVLATKAFGMGIDISDIKNVYHFAPTGNLTDYVQEIGRAARDKDKIKRSGLYRLL